MASRILALARVATVAAARATMVVIGLAATGGGDFPFL
jgi:hypothetical protein